MDREADTNDYTVPRCNICKRLSPENIYLMCNFREITPEIK